jgi:outer membrane lipoprotein LolB
MDRALLSKVSRATLRGAPWSRAAQGRSVLAIALLLLASCRTVIPTATDTSAQRREQLRAISHFEFTGRMATVVGTQGVSASLDWQQRASDSRAQLRAPFGLASLDIDYRDGQLQLRGSDGTEVSGSVAEDRLREWLGFEPPLASLRYWLLGCSDPASVADESFDDRQRLSRLLQDGWQIDYQSYQQSARYWLPQRLSIERDGRRLKLVINRWQTS